MYINERNRLPTAAPWTLADDVIVITTNTTQAKNSTVVGQIFMHVMLFSFENKYVIFFITCFVFSPVHNI